MLGNRDGVEAAGWPSFDPDVAMAEELVLPVQVNGKVRARLTVAVETPDFELRRLALEHPHVRMYTSGKKIARVVVVPGKLVSVVAR